MREKKCRDLQLLIKNSKCIRSQEVDAYSTIFRIKENHTSYRKFKFKFKKDFKKMAQQEMENKRYCHM